MPDEVFSCNVIERRCFWKQYFRTRGLFDHLSEYWDITNLLYFVALVMEEKEAQAKFEKIIKPLHTYAEIELCETSQSLNHEIGHNLYLYLLVLTYRSE